MSDSKRISSEHNTNNNDYELGRYNDENHTQTLVNQENFADDKNTVDDIVDNQASQDYTNITKSNVYSLTTTSLNTLKNVKDSTDKVNKQLNSNSFPINKNWSVLRNTISVALHNTDKFRRRKKYGINADRDLFMNRFSTQRRRLYCTQDEHNLCKASTDTSPYHENSFETRACIQKYRAAELNSESEEMNTKLGDFCTYKENNEILTNSSDNNENVKSIHRDTENGDTEPRTMNSTFSKLGKTCAIFHSQSTGYLIWLTIVSIAVLYNLWTPIARQAFKELQTDYTIVWFSLDALADLTYLLDIFVQCNTSYLKLGLKVRSHRKLAVRYISSKYFWLDVCSLFPLDLLQIRLGIQPLLRFPRFLKWYRSHQWKLRVESRTVFPNLWRVINLIHIIFLGCHWFAAFYYLLSQYEGFKNVWGYQPAIDGEGNSVSRKYLKSFYWATLTLTTIGDVEAPKTSIELTFNIVSYLTGVFVFATIVGQVGNIITSRNADRIEFEKILDSAKRYMRSNSVSPELQARVLRWYEYAWSKGCGGRSNDINSLGLLPDKLKTELALNINLDTLKKVTIFHECQPEFLHDIVLKMHPLVFTPGDLICRKGEIAREMFIIADGVLEVLNEANEVLSKMSAGDYFGEIGILNLDGINRRTADVRAVGYTELFVLSRTDILEALKDHPEAAAVLRKHAIRRLFETRGRDPTNIQQSKSQHTEYKIPAIDNLDKTIRLFEQPYQQDDTLQPDQSTFSNLSKRFGGINSTISREVNGKHLRNDYFISQQQQNQSRTTTPTDCAEDFINRWEGILITLVESFENELNDLRRSHQRNFSNTPL